MSEDDATMTMPQDEATVHAVIKMAAAAIPRHPVQQLVVDQSIKRVDIPGKGHGLITTRSFELNEQVLFVNKPLLSCLGDEWVRTNCYFCFRTAAGNSYLGPVLCHKVNEEDLKTCDGCGVVRYCSKKCKKRAQAAFHEHECKIFATSRTLLPENIRSALRLLLQIDNGLISATDLQQLLSLQSHEQNRMNVEHDGITALVQNIKQISGTAQSIEAIRNLVCIVIANSIPMTDAMNTVIGAVLHPLPSKINNACNPNCEIRNDVSPRNSATSAPTPIYGSMSVHALRPIKADEEITISYCGPMWSISERQERFNHHFFFTCTCELCSVPESPITPGHELQVAAHFAGILADEVFVQDNPDRDGRMLRFGSPGQGTMVFLSQDADRFAVRRARHEG